MNSWVRACLCAAALCSFGHAQVEPDEGTADTHDSCFLQEPPNLHRTKLVVAIGSADSNDNNKEPPVSHPAKLTLAIDSSDSEVRRSIYLLLVLCTGYSVYCIWHEVQPKDDIAITRLANWLWPSSPPSAEADVVDPLLDCHVVRFLTTFAMVAHHLANALDYTDGRELHALGNAFVIPAFSFASGVYNACVDERAVWRIWSCAFAACLLSLVAHAAAALPAEPTLTVLHRVRYYWYLPCLLLWRYTVLPLTAAARAWQVPSAAVFALVFGVCYAGRHFWESPLEFPSTPLFVWNRVFAFGPFFTAGALLPRARWLALIGDLRLQLLGAVYFCAWHFLLAALPELRRWNLPTCPEPSSCEFHDMGGHFPIAALYRPYSFSGILLDASVYGAMLPVTLAGVWLVGGLVALATPRLPRAVRFCARCGSRTLVALVLHVPLVELVRLARVRFLAQKAPEPMRAPLLLLLTLHLVAVLTCSTTVSLLRALVAPLTSACLGDRAAEEEQLGEGLK